MKVLSRFAFNGLFIFSFLLANAQRETVDTAVFQRIREAEMSGSRIPYIAHYLTDVAGPRLTNSPGYKRAGAWAIETMKSWGLVNAGFEPWGEFGRGWEIEDFQISMTKPYSASVIAYPRPWTKNTQGEIHADLVELTQGQLNDSVYMATHQADFKGRIVFIDATTTKHEEDFKPFSTRYTDSQLLKMPNMYMVSNEMIKSFLKYRLPAARGKEMLKAAGALAILNASSHGRDGTLAVQSSTGSKINTEAPLPEVEVSSEDGFKIRRLLESGQPVKMKLNIKGNFYTDDTKGYNVVAEIPGTDPKLKEQLVILGGHLDSWTAATGATDNAAGCVVTMEAVRLLDSLKLKPKRTIRILLWSGEEQGVYGSYNYVKNHYGNAESGDTKPEQAKVSAYFNLDNGSGKIRGIYAQNDTAAKPIFEQWFAPFHDLGATAVTLSNTGSTDHLSFDWIGIPGFQFIQDPLDYESKTHHTNMDNYDYLQMDDLKQAAVIVASFVYQASIRPDMLPRKKIVKERFAFDGL